MVAIGVSERSDFVRRQLVLMGILEDCIAVSGESMNDVRLQSAVLQLLSLFCSDSAFMEEE